MVDAKIVTSEDITIVTIRDISFSFKQGFNQTVQVFSSSKGVQTDAVIQTAVRVDRGNKFLV